MADETILTQDAQSAEDENRLAGNVQDQPVVDPSGSVDNPGGNTPTGGATDNTGIEQAGETQPPAAAVTQDIPPPTVDETGSSGGIAGTSTTNEAPQQPTVVQTGVAQSDPALSEPTTATQAPAEELPPTVQVIPSEPSAPPPDGADIRDGFDLDPETPAIDLPQGVLAEIGLTSDEYSSVKTGYSKIVISDPLGVPNITYLTIEGIQVSYDVLNNLLQNPVSIDLDPPGGGQGTLRLIDFNPATGEITASYTLEESVSNSSPGTSGPGLDLNDGYSYVYYSVSVTNSFGLSSRPSEGVFVIIDDVPVATASDEVPPRLILDETRPEGSDTEDASAPFGTKSDFFNAALLFNQADYGADGSGSIAYSLSLAGGTRIDSGLISLSGESIYLFQYNSPQGVVIYGATSLGSPAYFTISVDGDGAVVFAQILPIQHPIGETSYDEPADLIVSNGNLWLTQTVTDGDGDVATAKVDLGQGVFSIQDDGPTAAAKSDADQASYLAGLKAAGDPNTTTDDLPTAIALDETRAEGTDVGPGQGLPKGVISTTVSLSGLFKAPDFGEDGAGEVSYSLSLSVSGIDTGMFADEGVAIKLFYDVATKTVYGATDAEPTLADSYFKITVESDGDVVFTQQKPIYHEDDTSADEAAVLNLVGGNLWLTQTVTDGDGDVATAKVDLGQGVFSIQDDGPTAAAKSDADQASYLAGLKAAGDPNTTTDDLPTAIALDETRAEGTDVGPGQGLPKGVISTTVSLSGLFKAPDFGEDGAGEVSYSLSLSVSGIDTGMFADEGVAIKLFYDVATKTVYGATDAEPTLADSYFKIAVESDGDVVFTQQKPIYHEDDTSADEAAVLNLVGGNLWLTQTVTDGDGDVATAKVDLGQGVFSIQDDGPTAAAKSDADQASYLAGLKAAGDPNTTTDDLPTAIALDETRAEGTDVGPGQGLPKGVISTTVSLSGLFKAPDFGEDGAGEVSYSLSLSSLSGINTGMFADEGVAIKLFYDVATKTVYGATDAKPNLADSYFKITVESDGDVVFTQQKPIYHEDDTSADEAAVLNLVGGNLWLTQTVTDGDGDVATAKVDLGQGVFSIQDDGPTAAAKSDADQASYLAGLKAAGDPNTTTDDLPTAIALDETRAEGTDVGPGQGLPKGVISTTVSLSGLFKAPDFGEDGAGEVSYSLSLSVSGIDTGMFADEGVAIKLFYDVATKTVYGATDAEPTLADSYFKITVESDGDVVFTQQKPIYHEDDTSADEAAVLNLVGGNLWLTQTVTDGDGDVATAKVDLGQGVFSIQDDGPTAAAKSDADQASYLAGLKAAGDPNTTTDDLPTAIALDETRAEGTDVGPGQGLPKGVISTTVSLSGLFKAPDFGEDGAGEVSYSLSLSVSGIDTGMFADEGVAIKLFYDVATKTVYGATDAEPTLADSYFKIAVESDGDVVFTQQKPIYHEDDTSADEAAVLNLVGGNLWLTQTVTDGDGDVATAKVDLGQGVFSIQDDGPTAAAKSDADQASYLAGLKAAGDPNTTTDDLPTAIALDETRAEGTDVGPGQGLPKGVISTTVSLSGLFKAPDFGEDGAGEVSYSLSLSSLSGINTGMFADEGVAIKLFYDVATKTVYGATDAEPTLADSYFKITVESDGDVVFTQQKPIYHEDDTSADEAAVLNLVGGNLWLTQTVTDGDGDVATAKVDLGQEVFSIQDDGPRPLTLAYDSGTKYLTSDSSVAVISNPTTGSSINGTLTFDLGQDDYGSKALDLESLNLNWAGGGVLSSPSYTSSATNSFVTWIGEDVNGVNLFSVTIDKNGDYSFQLLSAPSSTDLNIDISDVIASANLVTEPNGTVINTATYDSNNDGIYDQYTNTNVSKTVTYASGSNPYQITVESQSYSSGATLGPSVFSYQNNTTGVGGDDTLQAKFGDRLSVSFNKTADLTAEYDLNKVSVVLNTFNSSNDAFTIRVQVGTQVYDFDYIPSYSDKGTTIPAVNDGFTFAPYTLISGNNTLVELVFPTNDPMFDNISSFSVTVIAASSNIKIVDYDIAMTKNVAPADYSYNLALTATDYDGDTTNPLAFGVYVDSDPLLGGQTIGVVAPVGIDLDGGGIAYASADAGVRFDYGVGLQATAWVLPGDGILAYDYNADGLISEAQEFVFTMWGVDPGVSTDMQALAAYFDGDASGVKDGILDAKDVSWDYFGVWQDLNTDGVQQDGEFYDLAHWGITSIALSYDAESNAYSAADGDVQIFGQMTVTYADGSTGLAEDMAFAVQSAVTTADASLASAEPVYSVDALVTTYLESMAVSGDTDGNGDLSAAELAYGLDDMVSQFIDTHGFSIDDHAAIQQEVFNGLANELNDLSVDDGIDIAFDATGDANGAEVLAALDDHFMDIYDAHITPAESYDDSGAMMG